MAIIDRPLRHILEMNLSIQEIVGWGLAGILVVSLGVCLLIVLVVLCRRLYQRCHTHQYDVDIVSTSSVARQEVPDLDTSDYQDPHLTQVLRNQILTFEEQPKKENV